jgi:tetratricopeptide (TPR) repeat protein
MSEPRWPEGNVEGGDPATAELARALKAAREREPDDVTMRRMWGRVAQPELLVPPAPVAKRPRWISFVAGVGCTAALAGAAALWLLPRLDAKRAPVVAARPDAGVETRYAPATEGTVRTGAGERLQLGLAGGAEARLEGSTVMRIDRGGRPSVDGGEVAFSVAHPRPGHQVVVFAGPYRVVLAGARFKLRLDESRRVYVDAQDGVVEVWDRARVARLASGESWSSPQPEGPPAPTTLALAEPTKAAASTKTLPRDVAPADDAAAAAQAALASGDTARALTLYRGLAKGAGPASENAAYEVGKILRDRLAQPTAAISAWRRYRDAHPAGVLRVEADVSIIETLAHAGETAGALAEANDFLRNHPDSERRGEIARVAGDLYRTRGEYKRAVTAYQLALSSPAARSRDDAEPATFHRAECLVRLGDPSGIEAARAYLRKWPTGRFSAEAERLLESGDGAGAARL